MRVETCSRIFSRSPSWFQLPGPDPG